MRFIKKTITEPSALHTVQRLNYGIMDDRVVFRSSDVTDERLVDEELRRRGFDTYVWTDAPGTYYPEHTHPYREVRWVLEGEVEIGTATESYHLKPGDSIELAPGVEHWARTTKGVRYMCGSKR